MEYSCQPTEYKAHHRLQTKLFVGGSHDHFEREADAVADRVVNAPLSGHKYQSIRSAPSNQIQRKCQACEEEQIQRKPLSISAHSSSNSASENNTKVSSAIASRITETRGMGRSLDESTRGFMESQIGHDFSQVNIHTGDYAAQMGKTLHAKAFTVGNDIYFNQGYFQPDSAAGKHLLAHELTHVVQQGGGHSAENYVQRAEIDDEPAGCDGLADLTSKLDGYVNGVLSSVSSNPSGAARVEAVYNALGAGVPFSPIEDWCEALPSTEQNRIPIERSRYSTTFYGFRSGSSLINPWILKGEKTMGTLINVGGLCIGSDKLGHFFQQGKDYHYIADTMGLGDDHAVGFGQYLEGLGSNDPVVAKWVADMEAEGWPGFDRLLLNRPFWRGVYGLSTTGVYSNADLEANKNGMEFYRRVFASPATRFSSAAYINGNWNERQNPSCFGQQMAMAQASHDPEFIESYQSLIRSAGVSSAYAGQAIFESMVKKYIGRYTCAEVLMP